MLNKEEARFKQAYAVFSSLALIGKFFEIIGAIAFTIGIVIMFNGQSASFGNYSDQHLFIGAVGIFGGIGITLFGLFLVVIAELGLIVAETEKNTRKTWALIESWMQR